MSSPSSTPLALTGDALVDGAISGDHWSLPLSIRWELANGFGGYVWANPVATEAILANAFAIYGQYVNINFSHIGGVFGQPDFASHVEIVIAPGGPEIFGDDVVTFGGAFTPNAAYNTDVYSGAPGDVFINVAGASAFLSYEPGAAGFALVLHELGHAFGLKHPGDDDGTGRPTIQQLGRPEWDSPAFTVMSYGDRLDDLESPTPATLMPMDVLALQYLYGKNNQTNAGDTVHNLPTNNLMQTVWDASGSDTLDMSLSPVAWSIQLPNDQPSTLVDTKLGYAAAQGNPTYYWVMGDIEHVSGSSLGDRLVGNAQSNFLNGNAGNDSLDGGLGDDFLTPGEGNDIIVGGPGNDTLNFSGATTGMTLVMGSLGPDSGQVFAGPPIGMDTFSGVENVVCGEAGDTVGCDGNSNAVYGNGGNDIVFGWTANDILVGGEGDDWLFGQQDEDRLEGGLGNDRLYGWAGFDTLVGGPGADAFVNTGFGESIDTILDYSAAQGDVIDVEGSPAQYSFAQTGANVTVYDPLSNPIFVLDQYLLNQGLYIV